MDPTRKEDPSRAHFYDQMTAFASSLSKLRTAADDMLTVGVGLLDMAKRLRELADAQPDQPQLVDLAEQLDAIANRAEMTEQHLQQRADAFRDQASALAEQLTHGFRSVDLLAELSTIVQADEAAGRDPMANPKVKALTRTLALLGIREEPRAPST